MVLFNGREMRKIRYKSILVSLVILVILVFVGCTSQVENPTKTDRLPAIYPDYVGVTIPVEIAPLNFTLRCMMKKSSLPQQ